VGRVGVELKRVFAKVRRKKKIGRRKKERVGK